MKKKLIYFSIFLSVVFSLYSFAWFYYAYNISNNLNKQFSDKIFNINSSNEEEYWCKFLQISPYGFPFKFGFKISGWQENSTTTQIIFNSDIHILYNIFGKFIEISHNGDVISQYKPLESGFGGKFKNDSNLKIHIDLSLKDLNKLQNISNPIELINFVDSIEFNSNIFEIYDLVDNELLYREEDTKSLFSFSKSSYYNNFAEFTKIPPKNIHLEYSNNVTKTKMLTKIVKPGILLFRPTSPFNGKFTYLFDFKFGNNIQNFLDIIKNIEITIYASTNTDNVISKSNIFYKADNFENNQNALFLKINSEFILKDGFIDQLLQIVKFLETTKQPIAQNKIFLHELDYIKDNKEKFSQYKIESNKYNISLDFDMITQNQSLKRFAINNFNILSDNNVGFHLVTKANIDDINAQQIGFGPTSSIKGDLLISNYHDFFNIFAGYFFNLGKFKNYSDESKDVHIEGLEHFLKSISDNSASTGTDMSFNYDILIYNLQNSKFGSINNISNLPNLYCISLFKFATSKYHKELQNIDSIKNLIPECSFYGNEIFEIYDNFLNKDNN
jgi:hypothetical protein